MIYISGLIHIYTICFSELFKALHSDWIFHILYILISMSKINKNLSSFQIPKTFVDKEIFINFAH